MRDSGVRLHPPGEIFRASGFVSLPTTAAGSPENLRASLEDTLPVALGQVGGELPGFSAGAVRIVWCPETLLVRADLRDGEVFTRATGDSQYFWEMGDVFEIFLEADGAGYYTEMHVAPGNHRMHMRIRPEDCLSMKAGMLTPADLMVRPPEFESRCEVVPGGWVVEAVVPVDAVQPGGKISGDSRWRASFCRYDAGSDGRVPVRSSTSFHQGKINFHARGDWRTLCF